MRRKGFRDCGVGGRVIIVEEEMEGRSSLNESGRFVEGYRINVSRRSLD